MVRFCTNSSYCSNLTGPRSGGIGAVALHTDAGKLAVLGQRLIIFTGWSDSKPSNS